MAIAVAADVTDEAAVDRAVDRAVDELGPPRVLVNNAGLAIAADLTDTTATQFDEVMSAR